MFRENAEHADTELEKLQENCFYLLSRRGLFWEGKAVFILHFELDILEGTGVPFILHFEGGASRHILLNILVVQ